MRKHDILKNYYREVWENGNFDAIDGFINPSADTDRLNNNDVVETNEIREWVTIFRNFVTNIKVNTVKSIEEDDWLCAYLEINCERIDNGAPVCVYQQVIVRFVGDQVVEGYPHFDLLRFFEQIGLLPENTFELLMAGTHLK